VGDWDTLASEVRDCRLCGLCETRTQTVFGVGNRAARLMVVGEAPGMEEDRQGEPFVGRAGQLLNSMLRAAGFERGDVYIANTIKCRPPNNRDPSEEETDRCLPYLRRQIALVAPKAILCVGRIAAQRLLGTQQPVGKLRGRVHDLDGVPLVVTYHPAYLLRSPGEKRRSWDDLKLALRVLEGADGDRA
jgi:DNA polymerase